MLYYKKLNIQAEKEYPFSYGKESLALAGSAARVDGESAFLRD